jgi:hypothetical protein
MLKISAGASVFGPPNKRKTDEWGKDTGGKGNGVQAKMTPDEHYNSGFDDASRQHKAEIDRLRDELEKRPPVTPTARSKQEEIKTLMRSLTYGEMIEEVAEGLSKVQNNSEMTVLEIAAWLHRWAKSED